jgi:hypothetical protein
MNRQNPKTYNQLLNAGKALIKLNFRSWLKKKYKETGMGGVSAAAS